MPYLLLARHGESEFNAKNLFTGKTDVPLTEKGREQAATMASAIKDMTPSMAYTSALVRAQDTLEIILHENDWRNTPVISHEALNERDYGDLTGKDKAGLEQQYGTEQFLRWRRGWNEPIPNGETLQTVYHRVMPYFTDQILPNLKRGLNILVVAHGNTLRALIKHLDDLDDDQVQTLEMPLVEIVVYDYEVRIASKQVRKFEAKLPFVTVNSTYIKE